VHYDKTGLCSTVEFKDKKFKVYRDTFDDHTTEASIIVIDGITSELKQEVAKYILDYSINPDRVKLVFVSSLASNWRGPEYHKYAPVMFTMSGWTLEEYKFACKDDNFRQSIESKLDSDALALTIDEKIEAKFDIAGHSARWMFNYGTKFVISQVNSAVERISVKKKN